MAFRTKLRSNELTYTQHWHSLWARPESSRLYRLGISQDQISMCSEVSPRSYALLSICTQFPFTQFPVDLSRISRCPSRSALFFWIHPIDFFLVSRCVILNPDIPGYRICRGLICLVLYRDTEYGHVTAAFIGDVRWWLAWQAWIQNSRSRIPGLSRKSGGLGVHRKDW